MESMTEMQSTYKIDLRAMWAQNCDFFVSKSNIIFFKNKLWFFIIEKDKLKSR